MSIEIAGTKQARADASHLRLHRPAERAPKPYPPPKPRPRTRRAHAKGRISLMQRVAGSTVTNDRQHGARGGMYGAHEHYVQPYPVTNF